MRKIYQKETAGSETLPAVSLSVMNRAYAWELAKRKPGLSLCRLAAAIVVAAAAAVVTATGVAATATAAVVIAAAAQYQNNEDQNPGAARAAK